MTKYNQMEDRTLWYLKPELTNLRVAILGENKKDEKVCQGYIAGSMSQVIVGPE